MAEADKKRYEASKCALRSRNWGTISCFYILLARSPHVQKYDLLVMTSCAFLRFKRGYDTVVNCLYCNLMRLQYVRVFTFDETRSVT